MPLLSSPAPQHLGSVPPIDTPIQATQALLQSNLRVSERAEGRWLPPSLREEGAELGLQNGLEPAG